MPAPEKFLGIPMPPYLALSLTIATGTVVSEYLTHSSSLDSEAPFGTPHIAKDILAAGLATEGALVASGLSWEQAVPGALIAAAAAPASDVAGLLFYGAN